MYAREFICNFGSDKAGLTTVGYQLKDANGKNYSKRATKDVVEITPGEYKVVVTLPLKFVGSIYWDTGDRRPNYNCEAINPPHRDNAITRTYNWEFDKEEHTVKCNGSKPVKLEHRLFKLWHYLYTHAGKKLDPASLWRAGWGHKESKPRNWAKAVKDGINDLRTALQHTGLSKQELDLIIEDIKEGKEIVRWKFNEEISL